MHCLTKWCFGKNEEPDIFHFVMDAFSCKNVSNYNRNRIEISDVGTYFGYACPSFREGVDIEFNHKNEGNISTNRIHILYEFRLTFLAFIDWGPNLLSYSM